MESILLGYKTKTGFTKKYADCAVTNQWIEYEVKKC